MRRLAVLLALLATSAAPAGQHLVGPGDSWDELALRARPGDEIILMPGLHVGASLDNLRGTRDKPITIRGLTIEQPSIIDSPREGIRLRGPQHVVIRDLAVSGATVAGITIAHESFSRDAQRSATAAQGNENARQDGDEVPWPAHVTIRNVTIEKTGPRGRRNAIHLEGVRHVLIERVRLDGWGGSALSIVNCADVRVEHSIMRGRDDHGQLSGIQIRAGSERIRITRCYVVDAGEAAIVLGTTSSSSSTGEAPAPEARRVMIERNVFRRGDSAVAFLSAEQCMLRNNAIVHPRRFAYFIAPPGDLRQATFAANVIVWKPGALEALSYVQSPANAQGLIVEQNLWWSGESGDAMAKLGQPAGDVRSPQVMDVDPDLDERFTPRARQANIFGPEGP